MASTKFFTNHITNTLFDKFMGIIEKGIEKFGISKDDFVYPASAFNEVFLEDLKYDIATLDDLIAKWEKVVDDPKLDRFIEYLNEKIFDKQENPTGKVVVFSESKDTINYLETELTRRLGQKDILSVSSDDRKKLFDTIQANFDANYQHVSKAHSLFDEQVTKMMDDSTTSTPSEKDNTTDAAKSLMRKIWRECPNTKTREQCDILIKYVELGKYSKLTRDLARLEHKYKKRELTTIDIETAIKGFMAPYHKKRQTKVTVEEEISPQIILSETFV